MRVHQNATIEHAARFALLALLHLEWKGLVPQRFTTESKAWHGIMPYLRDLDLFELAVRDGGYAADGPGTTADGGPCCC